MQKGLTEVVPDLDIADLLSSVTVHMISVTAGSQAAQVDNVMPPVNDSHMHKKKVPCNWDCFLLSSFSLCTLGTVLVPLNEHLKDTERPCAILIIPPV